MRGIVAAATGKDGSTRWSPIDDAERIYREQRPFMLSVARHYTSCPHDAEDAVQEAGLCLLRHRTAPDDERGLAWTLARNAARDLVRREMRHCRDRRLAQPLEPENPAHHPPAPSAEREALARLELRRVAAEAPPGAVAMAAGYTLREMAEAAGEPAPTVWSRIRRWREMEREG